MNVSRVNENAMKFVIVGFGSIGFGIEVRREIDFEREFVTVVDL